MSYVCRLLRLFPAKPTATPANTKQDDARCVIVIAFGNMMYDNTTVTTFLSVATATANAGPERLISSVYASTAVPNPHPTVKCNSKK